jgi:putative peptide zinc metalloprotease protein
MLCHACRVHLRRDFPYCLRCGTLRRGARVATFEPPTLRRVDQAGELALVKAVTTIGRGADNDWVLDDPSVSRRHARVTLGPEGFAIEDLDSFNGTAVGGRTLHGDRATLTDGGTVHIGDVEVRFEQPRPDGVGSRTVVAATQPTMAPAVPDPAPTAAEPLSVRPRRHGSWALKRVPDGPDRATWVLRNTRTGRYLQLDERDAFVWERVDGQNTVRDLLFAYAEAYGELALPRIERALRAFADADLVRGLSGQRDPEVGRLRRLGRALVQARLTVGGLEPFFDRVYRAFGWRLFTRTGVVGLWLLILFGLYAFGVATGRQRLFDVGGAGWWGALAVAGGYLVALVIHESAHALAVKSYGRTVTRGGFMLVFGLPFAFVDTSDMWFGTRWSRIVVTLSGPLSTAGLAGAAAFGAAYVGDPMVSGVCFQLAFGLYLNTLYNLNPLMPLDGYQALADALRRPRLRQEATAYLFRGLWRDLRSGRRPGPRQLGLAAYGLAAVVGMALFVLIALVAWNSRLGELVERYVPHPLDSVLVGVAIGVALFPIWFRLARSVSVRWRRARRPRAVEMEASA